MIKETHFEESLIYLNSYVMAYYELNLEFSVKCARIVSSTTALFNGLVINSLLIFILSVQRFYHSVKYVNCF